LDIVQGKVLEELIGLSKKEEFKVQLEKAYQQFWLQKNIPVAYPALWAIAKKFLIAFSSSYLNERGLHIFFRKNFSCCACVHFCV